MSDKKKAILQIFTNENTKQIFGTDWYHLIGATNKVDIIDKGYNTRIVFRKESSSTFIFESLTGLS
jgi:hypothetical protein